MLVSALFAFRFIYCSSLPFSGGASLQAMVSVSCDSWFLLGLTKGGGAKAGDVRQRVREKAGVSLPSSSTSNSFHPRSLILSPPHPFPSLGDCSFPKQDAAVHLETNVHH